MIYNESQTRAIYCGTDPVLVIAGPGSGKTLVMIRHILSLIEDHHIPPGKIMAVTFSRAAAGQMKARFLSSMSLNCTDVPYFGTFHSIFLSILRSHPAYSSFKVISVPEKNRLIISEIENLNIRCSDINSLAGDILSSISYFKSGMRRSPLCPPLNDNVFLEIMKNYEEQKNSRLLLDFDDIIINCLRLLSENKSLLKTYQERFPYICVDEFQDISPLQYEVLKLLSQESRSVFAVGDDDQSIYGFRGAYPGIMKQFLKDFPECGTIFLNTNFRSSRSIIISSLRLINTGGDRFEKHFVPAPSAAEGNVIINKFSDAEEQYREIAAKVKKAKGSSAILFRKHMDALPLLNVLEKAGIPFSCSGITPSFMHSFAVKDICSYIKLSMLLGNGKTGGFEDLLVNIINKPSRYIKREAVSFSAPDVFHSMEVFYADNKKILTNITQLRSHLAFMKGLSPYACIKYIRNVCGYDRWLSECSLDGKTDISRAEAALKAFEDYAVNFSSLNELLCFTEKTSNAESSEGIPAVSVMTLHASKGLEFDNVFIPDCIQGTIPAAGAVQDGSIAEEKRLFYVGMTRAKQNLWISYPEIRGLKKTVPSEFLDCLL